MREYIAIKVKGINHWFWFKAVNVKREGGMFIGVNGWGKRGATTNLSINEGQIEGELTSDELQYT